MTGYDFDDLPGAYHHWPPRPAPRGLLARLADALWWAWLRDRGVVIGWGIIVLAMAYFGWHLLAAIAEGRMP